MRRSGQYSPDEAPSEGRRINSKQSRPESKTPATEQEEEEGGNQKGSDHLKTSHHQEETVGDTSEMNLLSPLSDMESRYNHLDTPDQEFRELEDEEEDKEEDKEESFGHVKIISCHVRWTSTIQQVW